MRTTRQTPQAMNKPLQLLGLNLIALGASGFLAILAHHWSGKLSIAVFLASVSAAKFAESKDPKWFHTIRLASSFKRVYDPFKRDHFETEVRQ